jgi:hypothetical protein
MKHYCAIYYKLLIRVKIHQYCKNARMSAHCIRLRNVTWSTITCAMLVPCQQFTQKPRSLFNICQCADEPVVLLDLSLATHTIRVKKKLLLPLLSIESSLPSEKGGSDQQITAELLNEAFSAKSTQSVQFRRHKGPYTTIRETLIQTRYVTGSVATDTLTRTPRACSRAIPI